MFSITVFFGRCPFRRNPYVDSLFFVCVTIIFSYSSSSFFFASAFASTLALHCQVHENHVRVQVHFQCEVSFWGGESSTLTLPPGNIIRCKCEGAKRATKGQHSTHPAPKTTSSLPSSLIGKFQKINCKSSR